MSEVIKVLYVQPKKKPEVRHIENTDKAIKELVDGDVEERRYFRGRTIFFVNGTAELVGGENEGSPPNRAVMNSAGKWEIIHCSFLICGKRKGRRVSLTTRQIRRFSKMFSTPKIFYPFSNGKIYAFPIADDETLIERKSEDEKYLQCEIRPTKQPVDTGSGRE